MSTFHVIPALATSEQARSCDTCKWKRTPAPGNDTTTTCAALGNKPVDMTLMSKEEATGARSMIGRSCPSHNADSKDSRYNAMVPVGIPLRYPDAEKISAYMQTSVHSCNDCENFVPAEAAAKLGLGRRPMCVAKGAMLDPTKLNLIAQSCDVRRKGPNVEESEVSLMTLFPEYTVQKVKEFMAANDKKNRHACLPEGFDPATWTTPVTPEHQKMGIRGWVPVTDPTGTGNSIELPVFDRNSFDAIDQAKIPQATDEERPDMYVDHLGMVYRIGVAWQMLDETPALWGPPGVGKTELARHLAWIMQLPFERISITGTTELDDLQGSMRFEKNETVFHPGRVVRAWIRRCILLIDEPNVGPREVWQFLRPLTDNSKQLVVDADKGQPLDRDLNCFFMLAMNPAWDIRNDGANTLADADIRRLFHLEMGLPTPEIERKIVSQHCALDGFDIPEQLLNLVMSVAEGIRQQSEDAMPITWGIGSQIKVARYLNWFDPIAAYKIAAADSLEPDVRDLLLNEVRTKFGIMK